MSAMERTTYRRSPGSNAWAFDEPRRDPQHAPSTSGPSPDSSSDDSIPLFLSDLQGQPDPREFAPFAASQRTSILARVVAGGLVVSAFAILVAVFNSDVTRVLIDKAMACDQDNQRRVAIQGSISDAGRLERSGCASTAEARCDRKHRAAGYRKRLSHRAAESRPRPRVQGMKPLRRRKRSMPKHWQR